jgi:hypothetical protein
LFDGSEDADKVMTTTVIVGKPAKAPDGDPERGKPLAALAATRYWPVDIAYFDMSPKWRGDAGIPDQLQAARERRDPRSDDGLRRVFDERQARQPDHAARRRLQTIAIPWQFMSMPPSGPTLAVFGVMYSPTT